MINNFANITHSSKYIARTWALKKWTNQMELYRKKNIVQIRPSNIRIQLLSTILISLDRQKSYQIKCDEERRKIGTMTWMMLHANTYYTFNMKINDIFMGWIFSLNHPFQMVCSVCILHDSAREYTALIVHHEYKDWISN